MNRDTASPLIEAMVADCTPVRRMRARTGMALVLAAFVVTGLLLLLLAGPPAPIAVGRMPVLYLLTNGLLFLLGLAAAVSSVAMASPRVGARHEGTRWAVAMAGVLPIAAGISLFGSWLEEGTAALPEGLHCAVSGIVASLLVGIVLTLWLRRGAPVSPRRAGLHAGIAAGALGTVAAGLFCREFTIEHLGIWHVVPVALAGLLGWLAMPRLLRW
ncbi:NrsF family protein [Sphingosinithalassobacter portus]|uniref:NrsF family protein n=1 Tax=Stakelama portus TaxID=2676234 RepID=UPI000D6DE099|nr:NrsF family protein [Sphingosinithalassobacter portus]